MMVVWLGPQEPETVYRVIEPKEKDNEGDNSVAMELIVLREGLGQSKVEMRFGSCLK